MTSRDFCFWLQGLRELGNALAKAEPDYGEKYDDGIAVEATVWALRIRSSPREHPVECVCGPCLLVRVGELEKVVAMQSVMLQTLTASGALLGTLVRELRAEACVAASPQRGVSK